MVLILTYFYLVDLTDRAIKSLRFIKKKRQIVQETNVDKKNLIGASVKLIYIAQICF